MGFKKKLQNKYQFFSKKSQNFSNKFKILRPGHSEESFSSFTISTFQIISRYSKISHSQAKITHFKIYDSFLLSFRKASHFEFQVSENFGKSHYIASSQSTEIINLIPCFVFLQRKLNYCIIMVIEPII